MDAGWGVQLQLQAWPVPNRRIQPQFYSRLFAFSRCLCVVACLFIVDREWERACWVVGGVMHASWRASSPRDCSGGILQPFSSNYSSLSMTNWILRTRLGHLTATAQIASEGEGSRAECVRGSSAAKNDLGQPTCTCVVGGSACFGRPRVEPPPPQ